MTIEREPVIPAESSPLRIRVIGVLLLIGVFAAGAVFGAGLVRWKAPSSPPPHRPPPPAERLARDLGLDPAQRAELRRIEDAHRPALDAILHDTMPRVRAIMDAIEDELVPSLTDAQRTKLEQVRARRPPPGGPGDHPPPHHHPLGPPR